jgi:nitrogenase molybdenum-iron protein alpha/beta subunit
MTAKPVRYSDHLEDRLVIRNVASDLPERIIREAERNFTDTSTGYRVAVAMAVYRGADHLMMVVFEETGCEIVAVSIHPLEERDVERKIRNGRWIA